MSRINSRFINWGTGTDQVNARAMPANLTPATYSAVQVASEGTDKVSAHLNGIDQFLQRTVLFKGMMIREDWIAGTLASSLNWATATSGASSGVVGTANIDSQHFGLVSLNGGNANTGRAAIGFALPTIVHNTGSESLYWIVNMATIPAAGVPYTFRCGTGDSTAAGDFVNGLYFEASNSAGSGFWICKSAASATITSVVTTVPYTQGSWYRLGIAIDSGVATYSINGTQVATISTNIPTAAVMLAAKIDNASSSSTSRQVLLDAVSYTNTYTTQK